MRFHRSFLLSLHVWLLFIANPSGLHPERVAPANFQLAFAPYSQFREGYDQLPVHVAGIRGGGPNEDDRFKVVATRLKNETAKAVTAVRLSWYLFDASDRDSCVDRGFTALAKVDLKPNAEDDFAIFVVKVNEIPWFKMHEVGTNLLLEVAVTEVQYDDGGSWSVTGLPRKLVTK
jgi:hypothetical protein